MEKEYLEPGDWYVCVQRDHPKAKRWSDSHGLLVTFVPREYFDKHRKIRDTATEAEFLMIDKNLGALGIARQEKWFSSTNGGSTIETVGKTWMPIPMSVEFFCSSTTWNRKANTHDKDFTDQEIKAGDFVRMGFEYNRSLPHVMPEQGVLVEPGKIKTVNFIKTLNNYYAQCSQNLLDLMPKDNINQEEFHRNVCELLYGGKAWKLIKDKSLPKNQRRYALVLDENLQFLMTANDYTVTDVKPFYIKGNEFGEKIEDETDAKWVGFVRTNLNKVPTKQDFVVVSSAANLILTLPPGHATSSFVKTLRGNAPSTKKRPEYGIAKDYKTVKIKSMVQSLERFLKDRGILKYKNPPPPKNPDDYVPEWIQHRDVSPMEVEFLMEHLKELSEKYGK